MLTELAKSGGHKVETEFAAEKGGRLSNHVHSNVTKDKLHSSQWDFVVLQEQTQIPSSEKFRQAKMYPAVISLVQQIREADATPMLFITSAHLRGWPENRLVGYKEMQLQINRGYMAIANKLDVPLAPVGPAWLTARNKRPQMNLWQDGVHPNRQGTYLAACVFYAAIFQKSPEGLSYSASLPKNIALTLQIIAADTVLYNLNEWNL